MTFPNESISAQEAEEIAKKYLEDHGLGAEIAKRSVKVSRRRGDFWVVFIPPPGTRGGAFTITIAQDGSIVARRFER